MKKLLLLVVFLMGCPKTTGGDPDPVVRPQPGKELCPLACEAMQKKLTSSDGGIGCEEGTPVPAAPDAGDVECFDGGPKDCVSCVEFCIYQHDNGVFWNTECIAYSISTCEQIETVCNTQK